MEMQKDRLKLEQYSHANSNKEINPLSIAPVRQQIGEEGKDDASTNATELPHDRVTNFDDMEVAKFM